MHDRLSVAQARALIALKRGIPMSMYKKQVQIEIVCADVRAEIVRRLVLTDRETLRADGATYHCSDLGKRRVVAEFPHVRRACQGASLTLRVEEEDIPENTKAWAATMASARAKDAHALARRAFLTFAMLRRRASDLGRLAALPDFDPAMRRTWQFLVRSACPDGWDERSDADDFTVIPCGAMHVRVGNVLLFSLRKYQTTI